MEKEIKEDELPELKSKQIKFVMNIACRPDKPSEAYKNSYDCSNMSNESIAVEAQRLLKNPNIALWIEYYKQNAKKLLDEEIKYGQKEAFDELKELKEIALNSFDKNGNPNVNAAIKIAEIKNKIAGNFTEKREIKTEGLEDILDLLR